MDETRDAPVAWAHHGRRLLRTGAVLFLLGLLVGLAIPRFAVPRLALSTHLLAIMQATLLFALGILWPRLRLTASQSLIGSSLALYGFPAAWIANLMGAVWGAGGSMVPMAAGPAHGSVAQESTIRVLLISAALCQIALALLVLWGLRGGDRGGSSTPSFS